MSNSNITKMAYAASLRELVSEKPFEKITVAEICEHHGLTRKSFYYHFKDKNDLAAWIFDQECELIMKEQGNHPEKFVDQFCIYLYKNKDFYEKLLRAGGERNFSKHVEEFLYPIARNWLQTIFHQKNIPPLYIEFVLDGFVCSVKRWLSKEEDLPAEEFTALLKSIIYKIADSADR